MYPDANDKEFKVQASHRNDFEIDCTQMLWLSALRKFDPEVKLNNLLDRKNDALSHSNKIYANNVIIASPEDLGLGLCQKFLGSARISRTKGRCAQWQHWEWKEIYRRHCDPTAPSEPTRTKIALFLQRLVHVYPVKLETIFKRYKTGRNIR